MFEQENLQGWNISHIVSSWHCGLGKENAAVAPSLAFKFKCRVEYLPGKKQWWRRGEGWGQKVILGVVSLFQAGRMWFGNNKYSPQTVLITMLWFVWQWKRLLRGKKDFVGCWIPDSFPLYDLGKGLSGPLMQLKSGTRVNLNALSPPKQIGDEGRLGLSYFLKKIIGYC